MSKTLTEQWKDGELYSGVYYCKTKSLGIKKLYLHHKAYGGMYADTYSQEEHYPDEDIEEILAPVPSYEEFVQQRDFVKDHQKVLIENMNLKRKLEIATKALEDMPEMSRAKRALKEIGGVK